jgi:putative membrane protein
MTIDRLFGPAEREEIARAVREAEARTAGEIVVSVVPRCDAYANALWKGATLGALAAAVAAAVVRALTDLWIGWLPAWLALPAAGGAAAGYLLALAPAVRRWLVTAEVLDERAQEEAAVEFLRAEVFRTRDRTGILLFLALFERRVVVLGDAGINARVAAGEWESIVADVVAGIRAGRPAAAVVEAVRRCGELLERRGVARAADDRDELPDAPRLPPEETC